MYRRATFDATQRGNQSNMNANNSSSNNQTGHHFYIENLVIYRLSMSRASTFSEIAGKATSAAHSQSQPEVNKPKCPVPSMKSMITFGSIALSTAAVIYYFVF